MPLQNRHFHVGAGLVENPAHTVLNRGTWGKSFQANHAAVWLVFQEPVSEPSGNTSSPGASSESTVTAEAFQDSFKSHPARRQLREFMQILLRELLLGVSSPKQWLPLEVLLEVG